MYTTLKSLQIPGRIHIANFKFAVQLHQILHVDYEGNFFFATP